VDAIPLLGKALNNIWHDFKINKGVELSDRDLDDTLDLLLE
jgi:hypothetical protein